MLIQQDDDDDDDDDDDGDDGDAIEAPHPLTPLGYSPSLFP
jgi:hypothetical protein